MGRSVLITGSSSGLGAGVAEELIRRGWHVVASMRDTTKAGSALAGADVVELDVTSPGSIARAVDATLHATGGRLDALLLNAGYATAGFFEDLTDEDCRRLFETNLFGSFALVRALLPVMRRQSSGRIVAVSSNAVNVPHPMFSTYAASKWAIEGWCEALAVEVAPFGISVTVVQPGNYRTPFGANVVPVAPETSPYLPLLARTAPRLERIGRFGRDPVEASRAIADVLEANRPPFRRRIGPDDQVAALLKSVVPYRVRAWLLRRLVDL